MAKVICVLYDDPVEGLPKTYARDDLPRLERYPDGQKLPTPTAIDFRPGALLGCVSGELGLRPFLEKAGHSLVVTADKDGEYLDEADLYVKNAYVDEGTTLKRFQPRAQGRAFQIKKRTSHITVQLATPEVADSMRGNTISTFGGNPVTCTAARATIEVVEEENLVENARIMGNRLRDGLNALQQKYPVIGDVRGMGLMQGIELVGEKKKPDIESTKRVMEATRRQGLLLGKGGTYGNVLRIAPPLNVDRDQIDQALRILDQSLGQTGL